jgi:hypothetical protein
MRLCLTGQAALKPTSVEQYSKEWERVQSIVASVLPQVCETVAAKADALAQDIKAAEAQAQRNLISRCGPQLNTMPVLE